MSKQKKASNDLAAAHAGQQSIKTEVIYLKGDKLAKREGYKSLEGIEAVQYFLMQKHNWLPQQVKSMSIDDLSFCIEEEKI